MKVFVCLFAVIACASASAILAPAALSTGTSSSSRTQDAAGNYAFAYNEQHATGGSSRKEAGSPGVASGSYTLNVADGRQRVVKYVADGLGFRAAIATNEPGTAAQPAAATSISSPYLPPQQVAPIAVAPLAAPVAVAAPVAPLAYHGHGLVAAAPVAVAAVPAVSSYSTSVNHAAPAAIGIAHAPLAVAPGIPALGLGLGLKGHY